MTDHAAPTVDPVLTPATVRAAFDSWLAREGPDLALGIVNGVRDAVEDALRTRSASSTFVPAAGGWRAWYAELAPDTEAQVMVSWEPIVAWSEDQRGDLYGIVVDRVDGGFIAAQDDDQFVTITGPGQRLTPALLARAVGRWRREGARCDPTRALVDADVADRAWAASVGSAR